MKNIQIRDFQPGDREYYLRLSNEFYNSPAVVHDVPAENFSLTFEQCMENNPYLRGLALMQDEHFAGYALLSFTWSNEAGGLVVLLEEAYIASEYQGQGLGSELLRFVETEYCDTARRLRLEVTSVNKGAIKLYNHMGYQQFDYLQMIKELPEK